MSYYWDPNIINWNVIPVHKYGKPFSWERPTTEHIPICETGRTSSVALLLNIMALFIVRALAAPPIKVGHQTQAAIADNMAKKGEGHSTLSPDHSHSHSSQC